jgi:hypothetical protein
MQSDLADLCHAARARIAVPTPRLEAIERGALPAARHWRARLAALMLLGSSLAAAAVGAHVLSVTRLFFPFSGALFSGALSMQFDDRPVRLAPTNANLQAAIAQADFRVILPTGLPPGSTLNDLGRIGRSIVIVGYRMPVAGRVRNDVMLWLVNAAREGPIGKGAHASTHLLVKIGRNSHWRVSGEDVIVAARGGLSSAQVKRVEDAMRAAAGGTTAR